MTKQCTNERCPLAYHGPHDKLHICAVMELEDAFKDAWDALVRFIERRLP